MFALSRVFAVLTLALGAVLPARADIDPPEEPDWILSPARAAADEAFTLSLLSYRYSCATEYDRLSVNVQDGVVSLGFTSKTNPAVLCPAVYKPYGPSFKLPALKAGAYKVKAVLYQECHFAPAPCESLPVTEDAGVLTVGGADPILLYGIEPGQVKAGEPFSLKLSSPAFYCATEFSYLASRVQNNRIVLTFLDKNNPLVKCAPEQKTYGPTYKLAPLRAGIYEVYAERLPACAEQGCKMAPTIQLAGKLSVGSGPEPRKGWFLKEKVVMAGSPLTLQLLNHDFGSCQTSFSRTSIVVTDPSVSSRRGISTSFVVEHHPERVCVMDVRPHGPSFKVDALKPGAYPIYVNQMPACLFTKPACMVDPPLVPPSPVDTLQVVMTLGVGGSRGMSLSAPAAAWQDGAMSVRLPSDAAGAWRADLMTLSGKRVHSRRIDGASATLRPAVRPEPGVYLLRLVSPGRRVHTLRVPVKD